MRFFYFLLWFLCFFAAKYAQAFFCIETDNGREYPTLYVLEGESWEDVEAREGCTFMYRDSEKFTYGKNYEVSVNYKSVTAKLRDGTLFEATNIVVFSPLSDNMSIHYLNSEAKLSNLNLDSDIVACDTDIWMYAQYITERTVDGKWNVASIRYVQMPEEFTKPIYEEEGTRNVLPRFNMQSSGGYGNPERLHDLLDLYWAPIGNSPDSFATDVRPIMFEVVAESGDGYSRGLYISPDELNKLPKKGAFAVYAVGKGSARGFIDTYFFSFSIFYCIDCADSFTTVPTWAGDTLYSSDFIMCTPLSGVRYRGDVPGYNSDSGESFTKVPYDENNIVEFLDPNTGDILERVSFAELDSGKLKAHCFENKTVPGSDYVVYSENTFEGVLSTNINKSHPLYGSKCLSYAELKELLLRHRLQGWATFRVKSPEGTILSSGAITVNSLLCISTSGGGYVSFDESLGKVLPWYSGTNFNSNSEYRRISFGDLLYAFDPYDFSGKYNLFWGITLNDGSILSLSDFSHTDSGTFTNVLLDFSPEWMAAFNGNLPTMDLYSRACGGKLDFYVERRSNANTPEMNISSADTFINNILQKLDSETSLFGLIADSCNIPEDVNLLLSNNLGTSGLLAINTSKSYNALGESLYDIFGVEPLEYYADSDGFSYTIFYNFDQYATEPVNFYITDPIMEFKHSYGAYDSEWKWSFTYGTQGISLPESLIPDVYRALEVIPHITTGLDVSYLDKFTDARDYLILRHLPIKGYHNADTVISIKKIPCSLHSGCVATALCVKSGDPDGEITFSWAAGNTGLTRCEVENGLLRYFEVGSNTIANEVYFGTSNADALYYLGCEKGGSYLNDTTTAEDMHSAPIDMAKDFETTPFSLKYSWGIAGTKLPVELSGVYGFLGAKSAYVFEGDSWANFLYDNLSLSIAKKSNGSTTDSSDIVYTYTIPLINASGENYIASGGAIWDGFADYLRNQHQVDSINPFYDEELRNLIEGSGADIYRQSPVYAYLGTLQGLYQLGVDPGYNVGLGFDPIETNTPISSTQLSSAGFWNLKSLGFKDTGDLWCAIGTFEPRHEHNTFFPVRVNGFKRNLYTIEDLAVHVNLSGVTNSNNGSPDTYILTENDSGMYTIYDMLAFDQSYYNSNLYKIKWLVHYLDEKGDKKTITASDAEAKFGIKFSEYPWSKLVRLDIDCANASTDIEELTVQPVIYRTCQRFGNSKGNGFTDWQIVDSADWVPSNTVDASHSSIGKATTGAVISSLGNFWTFKVKSTPVCQERDLMLWSFLKDPMISDYNAAYVLSKLTSEYTVKDIKINTYNWGTDSASYVVTDLKGNELFKGKITYVSLVGSGGHISAGTFYWQLDKLLPDYLKSDLRLVYTHLGISQYINYKVGSVNNISRIYLTGTNDSSFISASDDVISAVKSEEEYIGVSACYPNYVPAPGKVWDNVSGAVHIETTSSNVWFIKCGFNSVYKWEGDIISSDEVESLGGSIRDMETGDPYVPGTPIESGVYEGKDPDTGETKFVYVNGIRRINDENVYTVSGGEVSGLDFQFKFPVFFENLSDFRWFGISGVFGARNSGTFIPLDNSDILSKWFVVTVPSVSNTEKDTACFSISAVKSAANESNILAIVGVKDSEMYNLWVQPKAILKIELIKKD